MAVRPAPPDDGRVRTVFLGSGAFAVPALQHELDHLDGKLYIDYLESMDELIEVGASDEAEEGVEERATALA